MASFVLVHGAWHGGWCWDRVAPLLREAGHEVVAPDLPSHGGDPRSPLLIGLGDYSQRVRDAARACREPAIAVGHSLGGLSISQAAADEHALFSDVIYLCAFAPLHGDTVAGLARRDRESLVPRVTRRSMRGVGIASAGTDEVFFADCSPEDATWAASKLCVNPLRPLISRFKGDLRGVRRGYIECIDDRAISVERQRAMAERAGVDIVASMQTSHSPFLSQPKELALVLDNVAGRSA